MRKPIAVSGGTEHASHLRPHEAIIAAESGNIVRKEAAASKQQAFDIR
jgi:hypothetical protein